MTRPPAPTVSSQRMRTREQTTDVERTGKSAIPSSRACTLSDAKELMRERYVHLVAILGEPDAGKTGCLVSFYLSVAHAKLNGFSFADSRTLMGFEEISQGARRWNGGRAPGAVYRPHSVAGRAYRRISTYDGLISNATREIQSICFVPTCQGSGRRISSSETARIGLQFVRSSGHHLVSNRR